ncbi:hypothetical protein FF38_08091 [Lucilia cuprina]|nr:hypothetical protein FF38_08091 [Lucilia cuprina]
MEVKSIVYLCDNCSSNNTSGLQEMEKRLRDEIVGIDKKIDSYMQRKEDDLNSLKRAFTEAINEFKSEMFSYRKELQSDIINCSKLIKQVDASTSSKISALEEENNVLHKRLNRADVVVVGLPGGLDDLVATAIKICSHYNINVTRGDINYVCYMHNRKALLVKFNSVHLRDCVMKEYYKTRTLKVCDVMGGDIDRRVYLNDHHSPAAAKLNMICRRLLRLKVITKYKILNADKVKAKLTLSDNDEVIYNIKECAELLNSNVDH